MQKYTIPYWKALACFIVILVNSVFLFTILGYGHLNLIEEQIALLIIYLLAMPPMNVAIYASWWRAASPLPGEVDPNHLVTQCPRCAVHHEDAVECYAC